MRASSFFVRMLLSWCSLILASCIDPYLPDAISSTASYLVVEGFINTRGITTVTLSRTYSVAATNAPPQETGATLVLEEEAGARYPLRESSSGTYSSEFLTLVPAKNYRLSIRTRTGLEYASTYVQAKITPPIDSVTWRASAGGVTLAVNTHDPTNVARYYRWDCEETWEIIPILTSQLEYVRPAVRPIRVPYPRICWGVEQVGAIKLARTTALTQDVVSNYELRSYPTTTERLRHRYSLLVKQYALTPEEYQYWELLKKNTENLGTLFDPLPVQLTGNVRCLSDDQQVALGYVGAHSMQQQRIFITRTQLPLTWPLASGYDTCMPDTVSAATAPVFFGSLGYVPLYAVRNGWLGVDKDCVDCRLRGSAIKPDFW